MPSPIVARPSVPFQPAWGYLEGPIVEREVSGVFFSRVAEAYRIGPERNSQAGDFGNKTSHNLCCDYPTSIT